MNDRKPIVESLALAAVVTIFLGLVAMLVFVGYMLVGWTIVAVIACFLTVWAACYAWLQGY